MVEDEVSVSSRITSLFLITARFISGGDWLTYFCSAGKFAEVATRQFESSAIAQCPAFPVSAPEATLNTARSRYQVPVGAIYKVKYYRTLHNFWVAEFEKSMPEFERSFLAKLLASKAF